jgi:hypothetical protein
MNEYLYCVEDGQFSFEFKAPLLGKEGDKIKLYDFDVKEISNEVLEFNEITIHKIDRETRIVECTGSID